MRVGRGMSSWIARGRHAGPGRPFQTRKTAQAEDRACGQRCGGQRPWFNPVPAVGAANVLLCGSLAEAWAREGQNQALEAPESQAKYSLGGSQRHSHSQEQTAPSVLARGEHRLCDLG